MVIDMIRSTRFVDFNVTGKAADNLHHTPGRSIHVTPVVFAVSNTNTLSTHSQRLALATSFFPNLAIPCSLTDDVELSGERGAPGRTTKCHTQQIDDCRRPDKVQADGG